MAHGLWDFMVIRGHFCADIDSVATKCMNYGSVWGFDCTRNDQTRHVNVPHEHYSTTLYGDSRIGLPLNKGWGLYKRRLIKCTLSKKKA